MAIHIGIDVGGSKKGYHAVALRQDRFECCQHFGDARAIVEWCASLNAKVIAIDAPSDWASAGSKSREVERRLNRNGIKCFYTPNRKRADAATNKTWNYEWVRQAHSVYAALRVHYPLFVGEYQDAPTCIETFPHAVATVYTGIIAKGDDKLALRRKMLSELGIVFAEMADDDFVDAALCAYAAYCFSSGKAQAIGTRDDGFIVVPEGKLKIDGAIKPSNWRASSA